jgi:hypothetical protein
MQLKTADINEKQLRNLRVTLAVVIAKLRLNNTENFVNSKSHFVTQDGLFKYIESLASHAMEGKDNIEIPEFYYSRESMLEYPRLKELLASTLTDLQRFPYTKGAILDSIYHSLIIGLRELSR